MMRSVIDQGKKTSTTIAFNDSSGRINDSVDRCGQQTIDCVNGLYTQLGWYSVGLTLASLFDPLVGAGAIGGCALGCLASSHPIIAPVNNPGMNLTSGPKTVIAFKPI